MRYFASHLFIAFLFLNQALTYNGHTLLQFLLLKQDSTTEESSDSQADTSDTASQTQDSSSESSSDSEVTTSMGKIGEGVEKIDEDLSSFSTKFDSALKDLNKQIETSISTTSDMTITLMDAQISQYEAELETINQIIAQLEKELVIYTDKCGDFASCTSCTVSNSCIWCNSKEECMAGDSEGPYESACDSFEYNSCPDAACEEFYSCSSCLTRSDCGWCDSGQYCLTGTAENSGDCDELYYYHSQAANSECPEDSGSSTEGQDSEYDRYISSNPTESEDEWINDTEKKLDEYRLQASVLNSKISVLESDKENIESTTEEGLAIEMNDIAVEHTLDGLGKEVDSLYQDEIDESREYEEELAESSSDQVVSEVGEVIDESTDEVNQEIDDTTEYFEKEIDDLDDELSAQLAELETSLNELEESVDSASTTTTTTSDTTSTDTTDGTETTQTSTETTEGAETESSETEGDTETSDSSQETEVASFLQINEVLGGRSIKTFNCRKILDFIMKEMFEANSEEEFEQKKLELYEKLISRAKDKFYGNIDSQNLEEIMSITYEHREDKSFIRKLQYC
ncbi:unnamed protein product [Blepharisma stoltei]|uniref:PSI domain-containing protein n=1 Tax=Blepharisma stoltei TaxID=1481888 RepID=A0AAU9JE36_9CILI|nr:unnamed protein product [Blepharisma stoltei]